MNRRLRPIHGQPASTMIWKAADRVQTASALFLSPRPDLNKLLADFALKPKTFLNCGYAAGKDWAVVFAASQKGEWVLPRLPGSRALYLAYDGIYLPLGVSLDMPACAAKDYIRDIQVRHVPNGQDVIIIPELERSEPAADLYIINAQVPLGHLQAEAPA